MKEERVLLKTKTTKNTSMFMEFPTAEKRSLIRNLYIESWSPLAELPAVKVTIEPLEEPPTS